MSRPLDFWGKANTEGMRSMGLKSLIVVLFGMVSQIAAQNGMVMSVYTVTSKSVSVQWNKVPGASSYKVKATPKGSLESSSYSQFGGNFVVGSVNSLKPNTIYIVEVEAVDGTSNLLGRATIEQITAPDVPGISKAYSKLSNSITVEFNAVQGASSYILRAESESANFFSETQVSSSPGTVLNLQPCTEYMLSVISVNSGGRSQPSLPQKAKTVVAAPQLIAASPNSSTIQLYWAPVTKAVFYALDIIMEGSGIRIRLNTTKLSVTIPNLQAGTTYCTKGNAFDVDNIPGDDITVCQITRPSPPLISQIKPSSCSPQGLVVNFENVQGADRYLGLSSTGNNCTSTGSQCILSPVSCGQNQSITITAINQAGPSSPSKSMNFITFPCSPQTLWVEESVPGSCTLHWGAVTWVEYYMAFIKRDDGTEEFCNTTRTTCSYTCQCSFTYFMNVFAYNRAGPSPPGQVLNYTTFPCCPKNVSVSLVSPETLAITWAPVRGAEVYETRAVGSSDLILCNDTSPVCALSDLRCNTKYSIVVCPCSERGCNNNCSATTKETAPCQPIITRIQQLDPFLVSVSWTASNTGAMYTANLLEKRGSHTCSSTGTFCEVTNLPCGTMFDVSVIASTSAGSSFPSFTVPLETVPCCPESFTVTQVTQAMTNVTWSPATGAKTYITTLTSPRGNAKCHTLSTSCLMGCITCGTNYTVSMEILSSTGHKSLCTYHGFSSTTCCPWSVKLYRMTNNIIRVFWHSSSSQSTYIADLYGSVSNYTCTPQAGANFCDVSEIMCGDVYTVVVAPLSQGSKIKFCSQRMYSGKYHLLKKLILIIISLLSHLLNYNQP
uniref:Fibronectin type III domain containing 7 n=1 Tax=Paramormyrops kingsleyae TaxID=1676925 RepID=A0A3B3RMV0_9TELE